jgi:hypothetical protein
MFDNDKSLAAAFAVLMVGLVLSACTVVERERSSAPPTVVMQPAPQQAAPAVISVRACLLLQACRYRRLHTPSTMRMSRSAPPSSAASALR